MNRKLRSNTGQHIGAKDLDDIIGLSSGNISLIVSGPIDNQHAKAVIPKKDENDNTIKPTTTQLDNLEKKLKDSGYKTVEVEQLD